MEARQLQNPFADHRNDSREERRRGEPRQCDRLSGSVSLCELADLSDLEVDLTIQERDVSRVFKGQRCKVRAEAYPDRVYTGVVSRLMPIADRSKGAIPVRVKLSVPREEEGVYLKPEMGAIVTFYKAEG